MRSLVIIAVLGCAGSGASGAGSELAKGVLTDVAGEASDAPTLPDADEAASDAPGDSLGGGDTGSTDVGEDLSLAPDPALGLTVGHLQVKGTHNSYHIEPPDNEVPEWDYTMAPLDEQLGEYGVRQVELDIHLEKDGLFHVHHIPFLDDLTTCDLLKDCLKAMKTWSDLRPGHHLVFVLVEPKDELDTEKITDYEAVDAALLDVWPRERIVTPDDVRGSSATLREALLASGWPSIESTRGKVLFIMLDEGAHRDGYLDGRPSAEGRLMFPRGGEGATFGAFLELSRGSPGAIRAAAEAGYLVRTTVNDSESAAAVLEAGAHIISTDFPSPTTPAPADGFFLEIPGGEPSRCNPVTSPSTCTPAVFELP